MLSFPDQNIPVFIDMTMRNEYDSITICGYQRIMSVAVEKYFRPTGQDINVLYKSGLSFAFMGATTEIIKSVHPLEKLTCRMSLTEVNEPIIRYDLGMYNSDDELCFVSVVYLSVFDIATRHLMKKPSDVLDFDYFNKGSRLVHAVSRKQFDYDQMDFADAVIIKPSSIDASGHVDNLRYIEMVYDAIPSKYRKSMSALKRFEIYYHHETVLGEKITIKISENDNSVIVAGINEKGLPAFSSVTEFSFLSE